MSLPQATIEHAKADIVEVIGRYLDLQKRGAEYVACCPFHQEKTPSFTVTPAKGAYFCFGCGAGGDAVSFVQSFEQLTFPEAVRRIVGDAEAGAGSPVQRPSIKAEQAPEWLPVVPVPDNAPAPNFKFSGELPSRSWLYRDANGGRIGYIARFELPGGGKDVRPLSLCVNSSTGEMAWRWLSFSKPRPLYGLDKLAKHPKAQVVIAEGEKSADGAQALYEAAGIPRDKLVVVSWPGGGKAVKHADWSPLAGRSVALWPDADQKPYPDNHPKAGELMSFLEQPGTSSMIDIADRLAGVAAVLKFIEPPAGVPDGWDLGDPLPAGFNLLAHTKAAALPIADFRAKHGLGAEVVDLERVRTVREPVVAMAAVPTVTPADASKQLESGAVDHVQRIADDIAAGLADALGMEPLEVVRRFRVDREVIRRMIEGAFWSGSKSKVFLLNDAQSLNQFHAAEAYKFLVRSFGEPVDGDSIASAVEEIILDRGMNKTQAKALRRAVSEVPGTVIVDHLKYHNQREGVEWRCDMFADDAKLHLLEDKARVVLAHKPFEACGDYDPAIIADYKQHFTRFDEFLTFLVQSRFALDRKKCYLWILADSDWGKGFLLGVLNSMRLAVGTSMKEIEAMFEGRPVGRAPEDFKRAFALVVDEFKTVKSELKQLQSEITLSPKNQLTASVEVFAKLFLSAESVASLVTENGVEDQFANRMSIFAESGSLVKRPLYIEVGSPRYFESVLAYTVETMNRLVAEMQAMGRVAAQTHAERWINDFIKRYGLDTLYDRFSDSLPDVAEEIISWLHVQYQADRSRLLKDANDWYLPNANKSLDIYLHDHFDASEVQAYRRRKPELLRMMSEDGRGAYPHTICGVQKKAVRLKRLNAVADERPI